MAQSVEHVTRFQGYEFELHVGCGDYSESKSIHGIDSDFGNVNNYYRLFFQCFQGKTADQNRNQESSKC